MLTPMSTATPGVPLARPLAQLLLAAAAAVAGVTIGEGYISRLPDHRGRFLVAVPDRVEVPLPQRPRRTVFVMIDGLGEAFARPLRSVTRLAARGQCRVTDVGPISVSRPVYAVLSTGLEQDRTGARNNDEQSPLAAESIWEVARAAGLHVSGVSDVPWWQQLFPRGFDDYAVRPQHEDFFILPSSSDLRLIHPAYIDHAGHDHGSASPQYAAAVARVDAELTGLLDRLDLEQDLVVLTADHGHSATGGHGGPGPQIAHVFTCFAGRGVAHRSEAAKIHAHAIAPTLALLLGLRFPTHMRAGEDDLDEALKIVDPTQVSPAYLADRRAAVQRFRRENIISIATWLGRPGQWHELYAARRRHQWLRAAAVALVIVVGFLLAARRRRLGRSALGLAVWCLTVLLATAAVHVLLLGSLDWTAINTRERYFVWAPIVCLVPATLALAARAWHLRDAPRLLADQCTLMLLTLAIDLGHIATFGWPLGFPLPGPTLLLLPFLASFCVVVHALLTAALAGSLLIRSLLARPRSV